MLEVGVVGNSLKIRITVQPVMQKARVVEPKISM